MKFETSKYRLTARLSSLRPWSHFKIHNRLDDSGVWHLVFGRLSVYFEDMNVECIPTCAECGSTEIGEVSCGDEGWTVCRDCQSVEQGYNYISIRDFEKL
jgi:hypothetical protein